MMKGLLVRMEAKAPEVGSEAKMKLLMTALKWGTLRSPFLCQLPGHLRLIRLQRKKVPGGGRREGATQASVLRAGRGASNEES